MALCSKCQDRNPVSPVYSKAKPISNSNCASCGVSLASVSFQTGSSGKTTEILAGTQIAVDNLSDSLTDRFRINFIEYVATLVNMTIAAYAAGDVLLSQPILWGNTIKKFIAQWSYNKTIVSQTLVNNGGLVEPTLSAAAIAYIFDNVTVSNQDVQFTISGNDGQGKAGSIGNDVVNVVFGNYRGWGSKPRYDQGATPLATLVTAIEDLIQNTGTVEKTTTRVKTGLTSDAVQFFYYFYPKRWGFATFLQNGIPGGFKRLKNNAGVIEVGTFAAEDPGESDILISNGVGSEAFYVYQSAAENTIGAVFDVQ